MSAAAMLDPDTVMRAVRDALAEDLGNRGDVTTECVVPADRRARGHLCARSSLVVAGLPVARAVFLALDPSLDFRVHRADGDRASAGERLATVSGLARPILTGERTALNFLGRMSGIATAARAAMEEIEGTGAIILDTRKTAPGLRLLDKYAVAAGGAFNHRLGLHDAVMIKDTHLVVAGPIRHAVARALEAGHPPGKITVEVGNAAELEEAILAGAGRVLLDNMDTEELRRCVELARGRVELEASGGLRPGRLRSVAAIGVRYLSLGWLTHSAPSADVALDMEVIP